MHNKNDRINLSIQDITNEGLGVAKLEGKVFFVKNALPGDEVSAIITKVNKNLIYAKAETIIKYSEFRTDPPCDIHNSCGGCELLALDYKKQLEIKKQIVLNNLKNIGSLELEGKYEKTIGMDNPYKFRNKLQVPYGVRNDEIIYGFYARRTHYIIPFINCPVCFEGSQVILDAIKNVLDVFSISIYNEETKLGIFREVFLRSSNDNKQVSITYIVNDKKVNEDRIKYYKKFDEAVRDNISKKECIYKIVTSTLNINTEDNNVLMGKTNILLYGMGYIEDSIGSVNYRISPQSFYQVNMLMTKDLYTKVLEYGNFDGSETVLDLFCGIGTISLYIASKVKKVVGIEIVDSAIENAKENAKINNITNAEFITGDVNENLLVSLSEKIDSHKFDCIVVDPPRKGLSASSIDTILKINPKKIIYVSCDSATLSRDLKIILEKNPNFNISKLSNVDMFPHTMHIETIVLIENRISDN